MRNLAPRYKRVYKCYENNLQAICICKGFLIDRITKTY